MDLLLLATILAFASPHAPRYAAVVDDTSRCAPNEQRIDQAAGALGEERAPWFARGEELHYSATFSGIHVGSGEMRFVGRDTVRGQVAWKASFTVGGGYWKMSVHDTSMSWFDTLTFNSLRFVQNLHDPGYHANRDTQIFPDEQSYKTKDGRVRPSVANPLDDVSLVYFVRTLPLEPGQCYVLRRYFQPEGNPVVIHVVRRDTVTVPAGRFVAFLLRPQITTSGIFSKDGHAELWLADDSTRAIVQLKTHLKFGSINLYLRQIGPDPER